MRSAAIYKPWCWSEKASIVFKIFYIVVVYVANLWVWPQPSLKGSIVAGLFFLFRPFQPFSDEFSSENSFSIVYQDLSQRNSKNAPRNEKDKHSQHKHTDDSSLSEVNKAARGRMKKFRLQKRLGHVKSSFLIQSIETAAGTGLNVVPTTPNLYCVTVLGT